MDNNLGKLQGYVLICFLFWTCEQMRSKYDLEMVIQIPLLVRLKRENSIIHSQINFELIQLLSLPDNPGCLQWRHSACYKSESRAENTFSVGRQIQEKGWTWKRVCQACTLLSSSLCRQVSGRESFLRSAYFYWHTWSFGKCSPPYVIFHSETLFLRSCCVLDRVVVLPGKVEVIKKDHVPVFMDFLVINIH